MAMPSQSNPTPSPVAELHDQAPSQLFGQPSPSENEMPAIPGGGEAPIVKEMTTLSSASARLVAAEEGLIGKSQQGPPIVGGSDDMQLLRVPPEGPGPQEMCSPSLAPASYDGANPFAPRPPQLPEQLPEQHPGPGMHPLYPQLPDVSHGNNCMHYNINSNAGWYTSPHGPYVESVVGWW
jgi:hypothetical protein